MDYVIKVSEENDLGEVESFFSKTYKLQMDYGSKEFFKWKLYRNESLKGILGIARKNSDIASTTSITAKYAYVRGEIFKVAELGDAYTHDDHQRKGLFVSLIELMKTAARESGIDLIYSTPGFTSLSVRGLEKGGLVKIDSMLVRSYILPLDVTYFLKLKNLKCLLGIISKITIKIFKYFLLLKSRGAEFQKIEFFNSEFDLLEKDARDNFDFCLAKNAEYLNWRYIENPYPYQCYSIRKEGKLTGYIIIRLDSTGEGATIADCYSTKDSLREFSASFSAILLSLSKSGVKKIGLWASDSSYLKKIFTSFGFLKRQYINIMSVPTSNRFVNLHQLKSVHFSIGDSDNI